MNGKHGVIRHWAVAGVLAVFLLGSGGAAAIPLGTPLEFESVRGELLPIIDARGGGRRPIWQGVGTRVEQAPAFLERFRELVAAARREDD